MQPEERDFLRATMLQVDNTRRMAAATLTLAQTLYAIASTPVSVNGSRNVNFSVFKTYKTILNEFINNDS